jgi:hypothetical protein
MKRLLSLAFSVALLTALAAAPAYAQNGKCQTGDPKQDRGGAPPKLSFCTSGGDAEAHWQHDPADSPNDDNMQDIELVTTTSDHARIDVMHVFGTPVEEYPNSSYEVKSSMVGPSLGSPRLVIQFSDGGDASLRPLINTTSWQEVSDPNWDNRGGTCGFRFQTTWQDIQQCHAGQTVVGVFLTTDPYGFTHWIDNLDTAGKVWNEAADNGNGSNG